MNITNCGRRMSISRRPWVWAVLLGGLLFAPGTVALADLPVMNFYFVQWEPLREAALVFPGKDVQAFETAFRKAAVDGPEREAYAKLFDTTFSQVDEHAFFAGLKGLIRSGLAQGDYEVVDRFMKAVTDNRWIQGMESSRDGGPFHVILTLWLDDTNAYVLLQQNRQTNEKEYRGVTFSHPIDLYAPADRQRGTKPDSH
jgi:hypothetical protein